MKKAIWINVEMLEKTAFPHCEYKTSQVSSFPNTDKEKLEAAVHMCSKK